MPESKRQQRADVIDPVAHLVCFTVDACDTTEANATHSVSHILVDKRSPSMHFQSSSRKRNMRFEERASKLTFPQSFEVNVKQNEIRKDEQVTQ